MGLGKADFNRIIDITFISAKKTKVIRCPRRGRKPSIEINGTFSCKNYLPAYNLTIKNLYLDLQGEQYTRIKIEAGYENNTLPIEGRILTMYQEEPGPEGKTVIQCVCGDIDNYLDATVDLNYEPGTSLITVLEAIKTKLKATQVQKGAGIVSLTLKERLEFNGTAHDALSYLEKLFEDYKVAIFMRETSICAICLTQGDFIAPQYLQFLSAPPQENTGDEAGTYYTTVTAPWMPKLQLGDMLTIPSRVYIRNFGTVGGLSKTQNIQVTGLSFHFGTTGGTNRMTVQGFLVR